MIYCSNQWYTLMRGNDPRSWSGRPTSSVHSAWNPSARTAPWFGLQRILLIKCKQLVWYNNMIGKQITCISRFGLSSSRCLLFSNVLFLGKSMKIPWKTCPSGFLAKSLTMLAGLSFCANLFWAFQKTRCAPNLSTIFSLFLAATSVRAEKPRAAPRLRHRAPASCGHRN